MHVYLLNTLAKPFQITVNPSRRSARSSLIGGLGALMLLTGCGGGTPSTTAQSPPQTPQTGDTSAIATTPGVPSVPDNTGATTRDSAGISPGILPGAQPRTNQASSVPDVLVPALEILRAQTQIPVLLPDRLPLPDEPIYASTRAEADRYVIDLGYTPNCRGNACMLGTIAARRGTGDYHEVDESFAQTIELADGTPAYFNPSVCGASCAPPVLEWEYGGARYRLELKGLSEAEALGALATLANSAIAAGDRLR